MTVLLANAPNSDVDRRAAAADLPHGMDHPAGYDWVAAEAPRSATARLANGQSPLPLLSSGVQDGFNVVTSLGGAAAAATTLGAANPASPPIPAVTVIVERDIVAGEDNLALVDDEARTAAGATSPPLPPLPPSPPSPPSIEPWDEGWIRHRRPTAGAARATMPAVSGVVGIAGGVTSMRVRVAPDLL